VEPVQAQAAQQAASNLFNQGVLGTVCVLLILALIFLYREMRQERKDHKAEMATLLQAHMIKGDKYAEHLYELSTRNVTIMEGLAKRRSRDDRREET
jgi:hypothetical protein